MQLEHSILAKISGSPLGQFVSESAAPFVVHRIVRYFVKALTFVPLFVDARGKRGKSDDYKEFRFLSDEREQIAALLNSTLFYWFWRSECDGFHCGYNDVFSMPYRRLTDRARIRSLSKLFAALRQDFQDSSEKRTITTKTGQIRYQEFYPARSKATLDQIDQIWAGHYRFTEEELDFIINYDFKYRMGRDAEDEEE